MVIPPATVVHLRQLQTLAISVQLFRKKFKLFKDALNSSPPTRAFDINVGCRIDPDFSTCKRTTAWSPMSALEDAVGERERNLNTDSSGQEESVSFDTNPLGFLKVMRSIYNCELAYCEYCQKTVEEHELVLTQLGNVTGDCTADYLKATIDYWKAEFEAHWDNITRIWDHYKRLVLPRQFEEYRDILGPGPNPMTQIEQIMLEFQNQHVDYDQIMLARAYEKFVLEYRLADRKQRDYIHLFTFFADLEHGSGMRLEKDLQMRQTLNLMSCIYRNWRRIEDNMEEKAYALAVQLADVKTHVDEKSPVPWTQVTEEL
ncbi:uncharacterized protein V1513DRAFT_436836 [Lipomyces chichibuensis]|uniref:uncharacterized protein n=1 Tax=Lipomyces chichibuensis TaxID=1546026 RepID=UPI003343A9D8